MGGGGGGGGGGREPVIHCLHAPIFNYIINTRAMTSLTGSAGARCCTIQENRRPSDLLKTGRCRVVLATASLVETSGEATSTVLRFTSIIMKGRVW